MKRFVQREIETPLSRKLLAGEITDHSKVNIELEKGILQFAVMAK
jgi:ATP-dependent Clp protease ATP-binding subunit ClpA